MLSYNLIIVTNSRVDKDKEDRKVEIKTIKIEIGKENCKAR